MSNDFTRMEIELMTKGAMACAILRILATGKMTFTINQVYENIDPQSRSNWTKECKAAGRSRSDTPKTKPNFKYIKKRFEDDGAIRKTGLKSGRADIYELTSVSEFESYIDDLFGTIIDLCIDEVYETPGGGHGYSTQACVPNILSIGDISLITSCYYARHIF